MRAQYPDAEVSGAHRRARCPATSRRADRPAGGSRAWAALWAWSAQPVGRAISTTVDGPTSVRWRRCAASVPAGDVVVPALFHAAAWLLMIAAMMLPTTLPLLELFRRLTAARPTAAALLALRRRRLRSSSGSASASSPTPLDSACTRAARGRRGSRSTAGRSARRSSRSPALFQFSALKYRCLDKCRTPARLRHAALARASAAGARRCASGSITASFCVGCCWALMLLMFVVGTGSLGWMLALSRGDGGGEEPPPGPGAARPARRRVAGLGRRDHRLAPRAVERVSRRRG